MLQNYHYSRSSEVWHVKQLYNMEKNLYKCLSFLIDAYSGKRMDHIKQIAGVVVKKQNCSPGLANFLYLTAVTWLERKYRIIYNWRNCCLVKPDIENHQPRVMPLATATASLWITNWNQIPTP